MKKALNLQPVEPWGGVEPSINRVQDEFHSQLTKSGHLDRIEDLDRIAALGIRTLRFPLLWEQLAPDAPGEIDWTWADLWMARARELGFTLIVGLVHHGSGPRYTSLLDPRFPELLADYARAVAKRYPWVTHYTPINEPLTTARFSCLYGFWYPHQQNDFSFATALLNQVRGIRAAMVAIREAQPAARLVQTEDLGQTWSAPRLQYQADFDNERRWSSLDLLTGKLDPTGIFGSYLRSTGVADAELGEVLDNPCPPDIIGINHYVTSNRWLDDNLPAYPPHLYGGNGRDRYVDVEAIRVAIAPQTSIADLLRQAWSRFGRELVITECCLDCTREEQLRWMAQTWQAAQDLNAEGIPVGAVCAWALFGCHDWNTLLAHASGDYQIGAFDIRGPKPRPTALAQLLNELATSGTTSNSLALQPGWWQRQIRVLSTPVDEAAAPPPRARTSGPPMLILGVEGEIGRALAHFCQMRGLDHVGMSQLELGRMDYAEIEAALQKHRPWGVVNAVGAASPGHIVLATQCSRAGIRLVSFTSADLLFDGTKPTPYTEQDLPSPRSLRGHRQWTIEYQILGEHADSLVLRTSWIYGAEADSPAMAETLNRLARGESVIAQADRIVSPTFLPDLAHATLDLLIDGEVGTWHLANAGEVSLYDFTRMMAERAGFDPGLVCPTQEQTPPFRASLSTDRGQLLTSWQCALHRYLAQLPPARLLRRGRAA